jgi:ring-1,2-phenylacetyl-CoA epoxidase subunit PaaD
MDFFEMLRKMQSRDHDGPIYTARGEAGALLDAMRRVRDPENGVSVVEMGYLRSVEIRGELALIRMTLSCPDCPEGLTIRSQIEEIVKEMGYIPKIGFVFTPRWTPEDISDAGLVMMDAPSAQPG